MMNFIKNAVIFLLVLNFLMFTVVADSVVNAAFMGNDFCMLWLSSIIVTLGYAVYSVSDKAIEKK